MSWLMGRLRARMTRWMNAVTPGVPILLYHRIANCQSDPQLLCVSPQHFSEHLDVLRRSKKPVKLNDLQKTLTQPRSARNGIVITFDDGYADNLLVAKPILEQYDMPATVFIAGINIGKAREFWWDELERIILKLGDLPEQIDLNIAGRHYTWDLGETAAPVQESMTQARLWNVLEPEDLNPRMAFYRTLCQLFRPLPYAQCQEVMEELRRVARFDPNGPALHRSMSEEEIVLLTRGGLIEAGAHTMTHSVLACLSVQEQRAEIEDNKRQLEYILGHWIHGFSYPFGTQGDYTLDTIKLVKETGFTCACSNYPELARKRTDPFQLPRFLVRDWDGDEFSSRLRQWLS